MDETDKVQVPALTLIPCGFANHLRLNLLICKVEIIPLPHRVAVWTNERMCYMRSWQGGHALYGNYYHYLDVKYV